MSELARIETVVFLQKVPLFSSCRAEEILRITAIVEERAVQAGETVYETRLPADALYCVVRGEVRVTLSDGGVRRIPPLGTFGVEELLTGRLRTGAAVAEADTLLLRIDADDLFDLLANNVEIVRALFRQLLPTHGIEMNEGET